VRVVASRGAGDEGLSASPGAIVAVRVSEAQEGFVRGVVEGSAEGV